MKPTRIILIVCYYNKQDEIDKTLECIQETFPIDIQLVDDGSTTPPNIEHLRSIYKNGEIFLETLPKNQGLGKAANHGLKKCLERGHEFIGRLDCGDYVYPNKYAKQIKFLDENPDIYLVGTWAKMVDPKGNFIADIKHPTDPEAIKKRLFINNAFVNSSILFRSSAIAKTGLYNEKYNRNAEDYAFFLQFAQHYKMANIPEYLLDYVLDPNSLSSLKRKQQIRYRLKLNFEYFQFNTTSFQALIQNSIIYFIPRKTMIKLKKMLNYNG